MLEKLPPAEKAAEAWGALASGRVTFQGDPDAAAGEATIVSSNGDKSYRVSWDGDAYRSDDPATFWQNYPGYPVLAVLMAQKKLPYDPELASLFKGVNWAEINAAYKRDYAAALKKVCESLGLGEARIGEIRAEAERALEALKSLGITVGRWRAKKK